MDYAVATTGRTVYNVQDGVFDGRTSRVELATYGHGGFVTVTQGEQSIAIDVDEWPTLGAVIDEMIHDLKKAEGWR